MANLLLGFMASTFVAVLIPIRFRIVTTITVIVSTLRGVQIIITISITNPLWKPSVTTISTIIATLRIVQFIVTLAIVIQFVNIFMLTKMMWIQASACIIIAIRILAPLIPTWTGVATTITTIISTFWIIQLSIALPIFIGEGSGFLVWTLESCFTSRGRF